MMDSRLLKQFVILSLVITSTLAEFLCISPCSCSGFNISCTGKELSFIPEFKTINGAHIVDLSNNDIEEIYGDDFNWKGIEQLQWIYLNINSLVYLHESAFSIFVNLEYIDLSNNYLEQIPSRIFENNTRLKSVLFSGNILGANVPTLISNTLQYLDLSFTKLTHFTSENIKHLPNLIYLNLQANNLKFINPNIFNNHPATNVLLKYNFFACNCSTIDVYNWAQKNVNHIIIDEPIKCVNKNDIYFDMLNKSQSFLYKESCNIDEDTFGDPIIQELSLIRENVTEGNSNVSDVFSMPKNKTILFEYDQKDGEYSTSSMILVLVGLIVLVSMLIGMALGVYISLCFKKRTTHRNQHTYSSIDIRHSYDNPNI